jgi:hypothetical protein
MIYTSITTEPKELPEGVQKFGEFLAIGEDPHPTEEDKSVLSLYFTANTEKNYKVSISLDKMYDKLSDIVNDMLADYLSKEEVPGMIDGDPDFLKVLNIAAGQLAIQDITLSTNTPDPTKLYFQMLSGDVLTTNRADVDWESNLKNLSNMAQSISSLKFTINRVLTADDDSFEKDKEQIAEQVEKFQSDHQMTPNYEYLKDMNERNQLIVKLIDSMSVIYEVMAATLDFAVMDAVRKVTEDMAPKTEDIEPANPEEVEAVDPGEVEIVEEGE